EQVRQFAAQGHKVLACVHWNFEADWVGGEPDRNAAFAGLLACEDRIRHDVREAVRECRDAGIRVIMLTGDHPATAASVARGIGLIDSSTDGVILGETLEEANSMRGLADIRVVARALPAQKLKLVRALRDSGEIVAVTGDGVNDVPALQAADIGIAMGERGTRSAREIASIVLLNDNFSTIVRAIAEGRQLFLNLQLSFLYILMLHIPLVVTAAFVPLAGYPILYLPIHIVWYEMIIHPTALLAFQESAGHGPLLVLEKRQAARFFSRGDWLLIGAVGTLLTLLLLWTFERSLNPDENLPHARAMVMVVLTCASASATAVLSRLRTFAAGIIVLLTLGSSLLLVQVGQISRGLNMEPLHWDDWLIAMAGGMLCVSIPVGIMRVVLRLRKAARKRGQELAEVNLAASMDVDEPATAPAPSLMRYAVWSVITALATIALKAGAYIMTGSVALLSDAAESLVNLAAACFALFTLKVASQPADPKHPFGHGKAEYFSSGFEGAMILLAATGIIYSAVERLFHPQPITSLDWGVGVAIVASALNLLMARALLSAGRQHHSIILEADGHHLMTDVWTTIAIVLGLGGVALTDWLWLDSAIAILAALNIVFSGIRLILRSISGLMGSALPPEDRQIIEDILKPYRLRGYDFHDLRARIAGSHRLVTFHVLVPGDMTIQDAHQLLDEIEAAIARKLPNLLIVTHVEPLDDPASFRHEMID
ncbi:MAG: cation diffusion facilitator family transporter, partial [Methylococcus sp.]